MVGAGHSWFHVRQCLEFQEKRDSEYSGFRICEPNIFKTYPSSRKLGIWTSLFSKQVQLILPDVLNLSNGGLALFGSSFVDCSPPSMQLSCGEFVGKISENGEEVSKKTAKQTDRTWCFCLGHCYFSEILGFLQVGMVELAWLRRSCSTKNNKHQIWATSTRFLATLFSTGVSLKRNNRL